MTLVELLPTIHLLPRADKLQLIQLLAHDVAHEDELLKEMSTMPLEVWSPFDAFEAVKSLQQALDDNSGKG